MYIIRDDRVKLLSALPPKGICAEIGVAQGAFARAILQNAQPSMLHLIDPWEYQDDEEYKADRNNVPNKENEERFNNIQQLCKDEIQNGTVKVHRAFSENIVSTFKDGYFDWIYIDAVHTYQAVRIDLENFYPKVKEGGLILGHDFTNRIGPTRQHFGVVAAVIDFLRHTPCELLAITNNSHPTYLMVKKPYRDYKKYQETKAFIEKNLDILFEVSVDYLGSLQQKDFGKEVPGKHFWSI